MVAIDQYASADALMSIPRLEADFFFLETEDFTKWRAYARGLAVESNVDKAHRKRVAFLIDQYPDPEIDIIQGYTNLEELKGFVPSIRSVSELAADHQIGRPIRVQALTSAEYTRAIRAAGNNDADSLLLSDWFIIAFGMNTPRILTANDNDTLLEVAKRIGEWNPTNVRLISRKIVKMTVHPGSADKKNESDSYRDFFDGGD